MRLLKTNPLYRVITISRMLSSLGSYIYNLVFVIYAASMPHKNIAIFIANLIMVLPTMFTFFVGIQADRTEKKARNLLVIGFIQAVLFLLVAIIIANQTFLIFSTVCIINLVTDILSDYSAGLRMPIIQNNVAKDDLYVAYSFTQFTSYICNIAGQTFGVWLLTTSGNNFALVALVNALSFLVSSIVLLRHRQVLTHEPVQKKEKESLFVLLHVNFRQMERIFKEAEGTSLIRLLSAILLMNAVGGAITGIYNFYFLEHTLLGLSYGQSLLAIEIIMLVGAILGSLVTNDYFSKQSFSFLLSCNSILFTLVGLVNLSGIADWLGLILLFLAAYLMGKSMPKLDALLMANLPADTLAQSNSLLTMLFTLTLPLGTAAFSLLATVNMKLCWLIFSFIAAIAMIIAIVRPTKQPRT
ncbi:MFS transporter [Streptococcus massiliensis]|uniref:Putative transporter protein n=1 Tax=Streptococcus massiliensis TaxID=313439 RepID=A0A380KYY3_9STRE|nr:MFS transporter [Streptococcus massiliensis]SUN76337.1 putative transporter protein [Streptococcus massiliensis]